MKLDNDKQYTTPGIIQEVSSTSRSYGGQWGQYSKKLR